MPASKAVSNDKLEQHCTVLYNLLYDVCREEGVQVDISIQKLVDAVIHHCRDMGKLDEHQGSQIAANKRIAGLVFWIRRIKPISFACKVNDEREIQDINEQAALWIAHRLLVQYSGNSHAGEIIKSLNVPEKVKEFSLYLHAYWKINNYFNYSSLVYSLRYRNFSPHHIAIIFDAITTGFVLKHTYILEGAGA